MRPRLRLYTGDDSSPSVADPPVSMRLGEITRILSDAIHWDRTWLQDFEDDQVQVSADLYEVLTYYSHMRPSA